ncbi:MAG: GGDEF domain-containing protein [Deltaproteobacteria bacterium]|nr:GGDEF domain-containing protein [Deltaproteobacteria bacterium]
MHPPLSPPAWSLPEDAVPFVRELVLEVCRRLPDAWFSPLDFEVSELHDASACLGACRALLVRLDDAPDAIGRTVGAVDDALVALLGISREIDAGLHRAVLQARAWVGDELAFSQALQEVLEHWRRSAAGTGAEAGSDPLDAIARQLHAKAQRDQAEALSLSREFDRVQERVHGLRDRVGAVEAQTRRLLDRTLRDPLTGVWNRRAWEARNAEEASRAHRYGTPLSLVVWDVDHLKVINEAHGHPAGDAVLRELARRVRALLRGSDYLARHQGEEFTVLLPNTPLEGAERVASKIRIAAEEPPIPLPHLELQVTVSAGVAELAAGEAPSSLLSRATGALVRAKVEGRKRVVEADRT